MFRSRLIGTSLALSMGALAGLVSPVTHAGPGREQLEGFFREVKTVKADFSQTVLDAGSTVVQESGGRMVIKRPNKFRWDYERPYEQIIVGDGTRLWLYDVDLEQVTVKPLETALGSSPAALLSGNQPLEQSFEIVELGSRGGQDWVELTPKREDATFERMLLAFDEHDLQTMELIDSFGQTTRLRFHNIQRNPRIESGTFVFEPPAGVDVIGDRE